MFHGQLFRLLIATACTSILLSGCGGDDDQSSTSSSTTVIPDSNKEKVVLLNVDGISENLLNSAMTSGTAPAVSKLNVRTAWLGGVTDGVSQQLPAGLPSWATLLTGRWAYANGVTSDSDGQSLKVSTIFDAVAGVVPKNSSSLITNNSQYLSILPESSLSSVSVSSCNTTDVGCVSDKLVAAIQAGTTLNVAELDVAGIDYTQRIKNVNDVLGRIQDSIDKRMTSQGEKWLIVLTGGYNVDKFGTADTSQSLSGKTSFIGYNQSLPAIENKTQKPASLSDLYKYASTADITPTIVKYLGGSFEPSQYTYDGQSLLASTMISSTQFVVESDKASVTLSWSASPVPSGNQIIYRDGTEVAKVDGASTSYYDSGINSQTTGQISLLYGLQSGDAIKAFPVVFDYEKTDLLSTVADGLINYYDFDAIPLQDSIGDSTLAAWDTTADGGSSTSDTPFPSGYGKASFLVDTRIIGNDGVVSGYKLTTASDITSANAYTVGFWLKTNGVCSGSISNGLPILSNKNWHSGGNVGTTIGLWGGCEIRFNLGGSGRIDPSLYMTDKAWTYVAMVVDKSAKTFTGYVSTPAGGLASASATITSALLACDSCFKGLITGYSLGEDGTGGYLTNEKTANSPRTVLDYEDLAIWNRALTADELKNIFASRRPLSTLISR